jgi:deoxyribodipyrimidine photo-lyase
VAKEMIHKNRIRHLIAAPSKSGKFVLYWIQQAQRVQYNHALCYAINIANELSLPLVVGFVLTADFPEANLRHYTFMLEGIADVHQELKKLGIPFVLRTGPMVDSVIALAKQAAWVVADVGYLKIQRQWREQVAGTLKIPFTEVETDVVVPVKAASSKEEVGARTLRPKIMKQLDAYLDPVALPPHRMRKASVPFERYGTIEPERLANHIAKVKNISPAKAFHGGHAEGLKRLRHFFSEKLSRYDFLSRNPAENCQSNLSPYLHFGQISPVEIVLAVRAANAPEAAKESFIEQLVVRRELAVNLVFYNSAYDRYEGAVPLWAKKTLSDHSKDRRSYLYSLEEFEQGKTHDSYWNTAQMEMVTTGKMHNYMRMYWGKKIIEWSRTPQEAYDIMLMLNNRYELDGRDANGFTGMAWCFGRHDRPWRERPIFGKVRYMNAGGLEKKFKIDKYVSRIMALKKDAVYLE